MFVAGVATIRQFRTPVRNLGRLGRKMSAVHDQRGAEPSQAGLRRSHQLRDWHYGWKSPSSQTASLHTAVTQSAFSPVQIDRDRKISCVARTIIYAVVGQWSRPILRRLCSVMHSGGRSARIPSFPTLSRRRAPARSPHLEASRPSRAAPHKS